MSPCSFCHCNYGEEKYNVHFPYQCVPESLLVSGIYSPLKTVLKKCIKNIRLTRIWVISFLKNFLGLHLWHREVSRPGVESELQLRPTTTAHGNTSFLTHWTRPEIEPTTSRFLVVFVNHWTMRGTPKAGFYFIKQRKEDVFCGED